ncbi:MAG: tetratricopeptide repeat protein [Selenomonadaceae bacterium]|nr:tetratricopeptide repeat protein [Selenomonadaceae bacterium]
MALADYEKIIELDKNYMDAYMRRGFIYKMFLHQPNKATEEYSRALEVEPNNANFLYERSKINEELENFSTVIEDLSSLITFHPTKYDSYFERGKIYVKMKNYAAAIEDFNYAIGINPSEYVIYCELGLFYLTLGERRKAKVNFMQAQRRVPYGTIKYINRELKRTRRIPKKL